MWDAKSEVEDVLSALNKCEYSLISSRIFFFELGWDIVLT